MPFFLARHNCQRYTRELTFDGKEMDVPFVVCGNGGHAANPLVRPRRGQPSLEPIDGTRVDYLEVNPAVKTTGLILQKYDDRNYGYLCISVNQDRLRIGFHQVIHQSILQSRYDLVTADLKVTQWWQLGLPFRE